jgi:hypothetical protein
MKNIQPISIWKNGENKTASILEAYIIKDDLSTSCTFYWMLKEANSAGEILSDGNATMSSEDYNSWTGSNDQAYNYIATKINVLIL